MDRKITPSSEPNAITTIEECCAAWARLRALPQQPSFRHFHLFDRDAHRIHVVFALFKQCHGGDRPRVLPGRHDRFHVFDLVVRLLFQYVQALQLIRRYQEKPKHVQILTDRRSA